MYYRIKFLWGGVEENSYRASFLLRVKVFMEPVFPLDSRPRRIRNIRSVWVCTVSLTKMNALCQISVKPEVLHGFAPDDYARHKPPRDIRCVPCRAWPIELLELAVGQGVNNMSETSEV